MRRDALLSTFGLVILVVLAGCTTGFTPGDEASPSPTPSPITTDTSTPGTSSVEYLTFDIGGIGLEVLEGGITISDGPPTEQYYIKTIANETATSRFNRSILPPQASAFVDNTSFDDSFLVVLQAFPKSSVPDYRVESISRDGGTLHIAINDSSRYATDDITVETVLIRVSGTPPNQVSVTTEDNATFDRTEVVTTVTPAPTPTPKLEVELPYTGPNDTENLQNPRGIELRNLGNHTNGYDLSVFYHDRPECREYTPPCGEPAVDVTVLEKQGKLRPGANLTVNELAARTGPYSVEVAAELPVDNGSRRTVTDAFEWNLTASSGDLVVTITDDTVEVAET